MIKHYKTNLKLAIKYRQPQILYQIKSRQMTLIKMKILSFIETYCIDLKKKKSQLRFF